MQPKEKPMRSCKFGLDYFPVDVDFFNDEKIEFTSAKHGILAELIAIKLLSRIYRNGYFIEWNKDTPYLYAKQFGEGISHELLSTVVEELLNRDFFNRRIFAKYNILTSHGIQKRFLEATKRRKQTEICKEYLLVSEQNVNIINQNVNIIELNVNTMSTETPENVNSGTQRKEKESKEKNKTLCPNSFEIRTSRLLFGLIRQRDPKIREPDFKKWADHINRLIRIDQRTEDEIEKVVQWCQADPFWQNNILSTEKLRKQFSQLFMKMSNIGGNENGRTTSPTAFGGAPRVRSEGEYPVDVEVCE